MCIEKKGKTMMTYIRRQTSWTQHQEIRISCSSRICNANRIISLNRDIDHHMFT